MKILNNLIAKLGLIKINSLVLFLLFTSVLFAQTPDYQAIRLNNGNPIIEPSMFTNASDGENINGPSLIRVPDWIATGNRAHASAQYYLYFAHHSGDYIRMAWAANIEGPYTLYDDSSTPGNRGVLDNDEADIVLIDNHATYPDLYIEENHLASPDVIVDDTNQRIIMYFHSGSSYYVDGVEQNDQVTWASTSDYGLEFYNGIEPVQLGSSYFRIFEHGGEMYALDNGAKTNKALDAANPWAIPNGHDFTTQLWERAADNGFSDDIPESTSDLRIRHTGVHVVGNQLQAFYSRRGDFQERIQLSTIDMTADWESWDPTYPPIEILAPNPGWEGGERTLANSETSAGVDLNQLRDPDIFEDSDGQLYVVYTGNGEGGLGIAKLYETPTITTTLTTTADAHVRESSSNNFGGLNNLTASNGSSSSDHRTIYMRFDLSTVASVEHAVVRLYANEVNEEGSSVLIAGSPISVYETSNSWDELSINNGNAPALGDVITTTYLTASGQYYDWNITEYAQANIGSEITVAFDIGPTNALSNKFDSRDMAGGNPGQLLIRDPNTLTTKDLTKSETLAAYPNPFIDKYTINVADYDGQSDVVVELINLSTGALISKETYNQSIIEATDKTLATGPYVLKVSYNNGKSLLKKMIKIN